jgi:hypothetical protein
MPTNILRHSSRKTRNSDGRPALGAGRPRHILIRAGDVAIRARLADTPTADRIWLALPIRSTVELWGAEMFFETPVESGRERGARTIVTPGEIAFLPDRDAIAIAWGPSPGSKRNELRLWAPANIWATALDDVARLAGARPGERVDVTALPEEVGSGE